MKDMIERYVYAVTRRLPEAMQGDVTKELKTNIYDMLPDQASDQDVEKVLLQLGHPRDMATKYQPVDRYLISPRYFGDYLYTLKIVVIIMILVGFALGVIDAIIGHANGDFVDLIGNIFTAGFESIFDGIFTGAALVTVVFVVIEYTQRGKHAQWNISDLPELPKEGKIKISRTATIVSLIFSVSFSLIFILILAKYHQVIGLYDEEQLLASFFNPDGIGLFVPVFVGMLALGLVSSGLKLIDGLWTKRVTIVYTIYEVLSLVALMVFFLRSDVINPTFFAEMSKALDISADVVRMGLTIGFRSLISLLTVIVIGDLGFLWYRVIKRNRKNRNL